MKEKISIPFAADGSFFHPGLRRIKSGEFLVGEKGFEVSFENYFEALEYLQKMEKARWRRPNENSNWGIVSAVRWGEVDMTTLGKLSEQNLLLKDRIDMKIIEGADVSNTNDEKKGSDFYAEKGLIRDTIALTPDYKQKFKDVARKYGVSKGEFLQVVLDNVDFDAIADKFAEIRNGETPSKRQIIEKMKDASPEVLAQIGALLNQTGDAQ